MSYRILCVCAVVALAVATVSAQTKTSMSGKCGKPDVDHSIPAGDQQGHVFTLAQGKCSAMGDIGGVKGKEGMYSEHGEVTANHEKTWGVYTETMDSGDKIFYNYQGTGTMKDGKFESGTNKYQIVGGTGKMKDMRGSGSCKLTGNKDGASDYECTGTSMMAGSAMKDMKQ